MLSDLDASHPQDIAPSVRALLAAFNADTQNKLDLAPTDSVPLYQGADGALRPVVDCWISDSDAELDRDEAITIQPTSIRDREVSEIGENPWRELGTDFTEVGGTRTVTSSECPRG